MWLQTHSGKMLSLENPQPDEIEEADILAGLSRTMRFSGQSTEPWSVLQHTVMMCLAAEELKFPAGFIKLLCLHDAHEAFVCDVPRPVKLLLGDEYRQLCERIDEAILKKYSLPEGAIKEAEPSLKKFDNSALWIESVMLFRGGPIDDWHMKIGAVPSIVAKMGYMLGAVARMSLSEQINIWRSYINADDRDGEATVN